MCPVLMHIYPFCILAIYIAAGMRALVYYKTFFAGLICQIRKSSTEKPGSHYQIIVLLGGHLNILFSQPFSRPCSSLHLYQKYR